jgi:hypothetical protein
VARLLGARSVVNHRFLRLREAADDGDQAAGSEAPPWERAIELHCLYQTLLLFGRFDNAAKVRDGLEPLAMKIGQPFAIARCLITRAWLEFGKAADLAKLETAVQQALKSNPRVSFVDWDSFSELQLSLVDFFRGNWASALLPAQASSNSQRQTLFQGFGVGAPFRQMAYAGDRDGALAILDQKRTWLPRIGQRNTVGSWCMLVLVIEGLVMFGQQSQAGQFYSVVR